ncbi:MAG: ribosome silencing factor [Desulfatirhabdiaceae bacterium]|nr:ribosome silencing factor [Desulfatirhabdiaceae bacterium]
MTQQLPSDPSLDLFIQAAQGKKALDIVVMDLRGMTAITDYFIICSGRSSRQVMAIADHIQKEMRNVSIRPLGVEGVGSGHWILLDYDHVVIHVFYDPIRRFYNLEGLWSDVPRIQVESEQIETDDSEGDDTDDQSDVPAHDS